MTLTTLENANQLDPGPPPRPRRHFCFGCRTVSFALLVLLALGVYWLDSQRTLENLRKVRSPHADLFQNLDITYHSEDVVRPLVDENQTFDIVATVWVRTDPPDGAAISKYPSGLELHEKPIFSETVFQGLKLKYKNVKTSVNLQIPTDIFKRFDLNNYDLRASFVLVPNSPSPLENATEFSSIIPASVMYLPVRSWPYGYPSIKEEIIDSYGTFIPLLAFHNIKSRCPKSNDSFADISDDPEFEADDEGQEGSNRSPPIPALKQREPWETTKGKSILAAHPYIITRSFLRVVDTSKTLNKRAYDQQHEYLKETSCTRYVKEQGRAKAMRNWKDCVRNFHTTGYSEVRIKLIQKSERAAIDRTEWAYAPHLTVSNSSWGPLDLIPVPVDRENCQHSASTELSEDQNRTSITVNWTISFSGKSPLKLYAMESYSRIPDYNMTDTETHLQVVHSSVEIIQSIVGHQMRDNYHGRRSTTLQVLSLILHLTASFLDFHYWYTCSSTIGISTNGIGLVAASTIASSVVRMAMDTLKHRMSFSFRFIILIYLVPMNIWATVVLRAVSRAELHWWHKWTPVLRFALPTHAERSSQRVDARVPYRFKAPLFAILAAFFYSVHQQYSLDNLDDTVVHTLDVMRSIILRAAMTFGWALQLLLNYRMKTFAGAYRMGAYIKLFGLGLGWMAYSPWVVGERVYRPGVGYDGFPELVLCAILAFQAFIYPSVSVLDEEDETK